MIIEFFITRRLQKNRNKNFKVFRFFFILSFFILSVQRMGIKNDFVCQLSVVGQSHWQFHSLVRRQSDEQPRSREARRVRAEGKSHGEVALGTEVEAKAVGGGCGFRM